MSIPYTYTKNVGVNECYVSGPNTGVYTNMTSVPETVLIGGTVCNVVGFADNCFQNIIFTNANFGDLSIGPLSKIFGNIKYIGIQAFFSAQFTGAFPALRALQTIGNSAFQSAQFTGAFPALPVLAQTVPSVFNSSTFDPPTITTVNPAGSSGTSFTLYCTGLVDIDTRTVSATFGAGALTLSSYTNNKIVFTIPQGTGTSLITVKVGTAASAPVTFTYIQPIEYTYIAQNTTECYVSGATNVQSGFSYSMPPVPATVLIGGTVCNVVGFADNCFQNIIFTNANFGDLSIGPLSQIFGNIKYIGSQAFRAAQFTGAFPALPLLTSIGANAFNSAQFTGAFPALPALQTIGSNAFSTYGLPGVPQTGSPFTSVAGAPNTFMAGVLSFPLVSIGTSAFFYAQFTGAFPALTALQTIGGGAFSNAQFTGAFPALPALQTISSNAFSNYGLVGLPTKTGSLFTSVEGAPNTFMAGVSSSMLTIIGNNAFSNAQFTGAFPALPLLQTIGIRAFSYAQFTGAFPALPLLQTIGTNAFSTYGFVGTQTGSPFTSVEGASNTFMAGVLSSALVGIGNNAFFYAQFTGAFPALPLLQNIGTNAFPSALFTGAFPALPGLAQTTTDVFYNSTFSRPTITTSNPTDAAGTTYTLYCTGLVYTNAGGVSAAFGAIDPLPITYTNNKIVFTVPAQTANPVPITVTAGGNTSTPAVLFTYPTPPSPPGPPLTPGATRGDTTIALSWTAPSTGGAVQSYYYSIDGGSSKVQVPGSTSSTTSYTIPDLTNGILYSCIIYAYNSQGFSNPSTAVTATPTPTVAPNAPTLTTASCTAGNTTITLVWTLPSPIPPSVSNYAYSATKSGDPVDIVQIGNVLTYTVQGLTNGVSYVCRVYAQNTIGSQVSSATFTGMPATNPDPPTGVGATAGNASADVRWTAPVNTGASSITSYTVTSNPLVTPQTTTTGTTLSYPGLTNGTPYTFTVKATNNANLTSVDSTASAGVTPSTVPGAPTGATATAGNISAVVSWTPPVNTGGAAITSYTITNNINSATYSPTSSPFTVPNLLSTTSYTFSITANNINGPSLAAATTNAVTPNPAAYPSAPLNVLATAGNASAEVSWTAPLSTGATSITSYTVTSVPPVGGSHTVAGTLLSYNYGALTNGTAYTFSVTATNNGSLTSPAGTSESVTPAEVEVPTEYVIQISSFNVFGTNFRGMGNLGDYY